MFCEGERVVEQASPQLFELRRTFERARGVELFTEHSSCHDHSLLQTGERTQTDKQTDKRTDGRYQLNQVHYLPASLSYAVDNTRPPPVEVRLDTDPLPLSSARGFCLGGGGGGALA